MKLTPQIAAIYIGCKVQTKLRAETKQGEPMKKLMGTLMEVDLQNINPLGILLENEKDICNYTFLGCDEVVLILTKIQTISKQTLIDLYQIYRQKDNLKFSIEQFQKLVENRVDIFNLD